MAKDPTGPQWPHLLQMACLGLGLGVGLTVAHEFGETHLSRALIGAGVAGVVTLLWSGVVWLVFLRNRG
jgi:hypothetical protein